MTSALRAEAPESCSIRNATPEDVSLILQLIRELAAYEKLGHEATATEDLITRNLFGPKKYAECLIAEVDNGPVGFALFFHNFSTFLGKPGLYLEDLFVRTAYRRQGIALQLLRALAKIAIARDCGRMEWWVLNWNETALNFYRQLGARAMNEWTVQRLNRPEIEKLAEG